MKNICDPRFFDSPLKGSRMGRADEVSLWYVSLLHYTFYILE